MSIQDLCQNFTDVVEAKVAPRGWRSVTLTSSSDRPVYPLVSVPTATQATFEVIQSDCRWFPEQPPHHKSIGLRVYRCRIEAPPPHVSGVRQNTSNPWRNLELMAEHPTVQAHSIMLEIARLEPDCLYIASVETGSEATTTPPWVVSLRILTAEGAKVRELSSPEALYFHQAQPRAREVLDDSGSFSSQGTSDAEAANYPESKRRDPMRPTCSRASSSGGGGEPLAPRLEQIVPRRRHGPEAIEALNLPDFVKTWISTCAGLHH